MHVFDLMGLLYLAIWIIGGYAILRESRLHPPLVKWMAVFAIVLGPPGMLIYLGFRYIGQRLDRHALPPARD